MAEVKEFLDYEGLKTYDGKIKEKIATDTTTAKGEAIEASKITVDTTSTTDGYAKTYTVKQNGSEIGKIDIPKDMVVSEAKVVEDPVDKPAGTYIELTIANSDGTKLYIDVSKLVDNYTAASEADQIKITISEDREISATLVEGGVDTDAIAANAVTKAKLGTDVTDLLDKADTAVQNVITGTTEGTISVDSQDVKVNGFDNLKAQVETLNESAPTSISTEDIESLFSPAA